MSKHWPRRHAPLPPKCKHCCNPYQYCGGTIKLAFAAKNPELTVDLAVELAVRTPKKAAVKDILTIRRARQTRKQANRRASFASNYNTPCGHLDSATLHLVVAGFALCIKRQKHFLVSKLPRNVPAFLYARLSHTRKKRTNPKAPTSSKSVLHSGPPFSPACHSSSKHGALGKSIVAKCNVYKEFMTLVAANLTARWEK